jgi:hydrolase, P-loop family
MGEIKIKIHSEEEIIELGEFITSFAYPSQVFALNGDLGAGKTTFTKGVGKCLGVKRVINSPTFTIMKIYDVTNQVNGIEKLYHLDVYRLTNSKSDFELEEYFYQNGLTIIEWANIIDDILPKHTCYLYIYRLTDTTRMIELKNFSSDVIDKIGEKYEVIHG